MKTNKTLEEKMKEAELHMPGIGQKLQPYNINGGSYQPLWKREPTDVEIGTTDTHKYVAVKWHDDHAATGSGGIQWTEWVSFHYMLKETAEEIKHLDTPQIVVRDMYSASKDRPYLWNFGFVGARPINSTSVEVFWADVEGKEVLNYKLTLE